MIVSHVCSLRYAKQNNMQLNIQNFCVDKKPLDIAHVISLSLFASLFHMKGYG